jgi:hypothetical protein
MLAFICFFFPAFMSISIERHLFKKCIVNLDLVLNYLLYCFFTDIITVALLTIITNKTYYFEEAINLYPSVASKFALMAIVISSLLPFFKHFLMNDIGVSVDEKKS